MYHIYFIYFSIDGHLDCFHVLAIVNSVATNTGEHAAAAAAKSRQSCPTLCDPIDGSPPGSRPWDSPGKSTGVVCHCLLHIKLESTVNLHILIISLFLFYHISNCGKLHSLRAGTICGVPLTSWFLKIFIKMICT